MEEFEVVLKQFEPMITRILKRANIYKNHEQFRQSARIALWNAWKNYNPERGPFAPYAYRSMQTSIFNEMNFENNYANHQISYEQDKLTSVAEIMEEKRDGAGHSEILDFLREHLAENEMELIVDIYIKGYSYEELSKMYGISTAALRKRRDRLMNKIRGRLIVE